MCPGKRMTFETSQTRAQILLPYAARGDFGKVAKLPCACFRDKRSPARSESRVK